MAQAIAFIGAQRAIDLALSAEQSHLGFLKALHAGSARFALLGHRALGEATAAAAAHLGGLAGQFRESLAALFGVQGAQVP